MIIYLRPKKTSYLIMLQIIVNHDKTVVNVHEIANETRLPKRMRNAIKPLVSGGDVLVCYDHERKGNYEYAEREILNKYLTN